MPGPVAAAPQKRRGPDPKKIEQIEREVRVNMPAAFNQLQDLENNLLAFYNWERTKAGIQYLMKNGHIVGESFEDVRAGTYNVLKNTVLLGRAGMNFGGGACNEYSAAGLYEYMRSDELYPITRFWDLEIGHSFDVVGDIRLDGAMILDPWLTERKPQPFWETALPLDRLNIVDEWAPRAPEEGKQKIEDFRRDIDNTAYFESAKHVGSPIEYIKEQSNMLEKYEKATPEERRSFQLYRHPDHALRSTWDTRARRWALSWTQENTKESFPFWDISRSSVLQNILDIDMYF